MKVDLGKFSNPEYDPGGSALKRVLWYFTNILVFMNPLIPVVGIKLTILRLFGAEIGAGIVIKPRVNIKYPWKLRVGNNSWIGEGVWIDNLADVVIGNNVCLSQGCYLLTGNHDYRTEDFKLMVGQIEIQDGAWVGAFSIVCPGVVLHENSILSVQSVATKSLENNWIYQGNPAQKRRIRFGESSETNQVH